MAAATVGALRVTLGVNTAQYEAGMTRAQQQARRTGQDISTSMTTASRSVNTAFNSMKSALAGFAVGVATAGAAALGGMARSVLEFADNLDAAAQQAGMSVERYQTLREAFRALEVDARSTDRIFRQLQTTLGDVQNGADNSATQALERLGIRSRILNGEITTSDQLLDALAESARTAGTAAQFTSEIVDIFGQRVGPQLAAAIRDGGAALHGLEQAMRETGTVIDEEMVQRLAEANETLDRFFETSQRNAAIWAAEMIEAFQSAGAAILDFHNMLPEGMRMTSFGAAITSLMGAPGGRAAAMPGRNAGLIGSALNQLNPTRGRRPPRARSGGGGGGSSRRRAGGGSTRAERATRVEPDDFTSPWTYGMSLAEQAEDAARLASELPRVEDLLNEIAAVPIPDLGNMLTTEDREELEAFTDSFTRDLTDGLAAAIVYGEDLGDVLVNTIQRAAHELISSGLMQLLTGQGKTGGLIGSIISSLGIGMTGIGGGAFGPKVGAGMKGASGYLAGFASGGSFMVGGNAGVDRNLLSLNGVPVARVSRGETVGVSPNGGGGVLEVRLRDEMLAARITEGAGIVVAKAYPAMKADTMRSINEQGRRR